MNNNSGLPHWDVSDVYPTLDSQEFKADFEEVIRSIEALRVLFDKHEVRGSDEVETDADAFESVLSAYNELRSKMRKVSSYISAFTSTDSRNELAQSRSSELTTQSVELSRLSLRLQAWVGSMDLDTLLERSEMARDHEFPLRKFQQSAEHQMSEVEEDLAASLAPTGSSAWSRLYGNVTSRLIVDLKKPDGNIERLPISAVRGGRDGAGRHSLLASGDATEAAGLSHSGFRRSSESMS